MMLTTSWNPDKLPQHHFEKCMMICDVIILNCIANYMLQGRIQDLKLGVAQMDWKIRKARGIV